MTSIYLEMILNRIINLSGATKEEIIGDSRRHILVCCRALFVYICNQKGLNPEDYCATIRRDRTTVYKYASKVYYAPIFIDLKNRYMQKYEKGEN